VRNIRFVFPVPVRPDGEQPEVETQKHTNKVGRKPVVVCPHDPYTKRGSEFPYVKDQARVLPHGRRITCLPAPSLSSGIQHRSEELMVDIQHRSGKEEQGFHIGYRADEPEVESGDDFRFPYS
jgi:hypothetical protein